MAVLQGLGRTTVVTPGTPVQIQPTGITPQSCHAFIVEALPGNTGKVYVGTLGLDKSTLAATLVVLPVPTANLIPTFSVSVTGAPNALDLGNLWVDADNANDGVLVSVIIS